MDAGLEQPPERLPYHSGQHERCPGYHDDPSRTVTGAHEQRTGGDGQEAKAYKNHRHQKRLLLIVSTFEVLRLSLFNDPGFQRLCDCIFNEPPGNTGFSVAVSDIGQVLKVGMHDPRKPDFQLFVGHKYILPGFRPPKDGHLSVNWQTQDA
ncbi:hypothetical protein [uncultured Parvibaculum sp.]|uniref:hypothetical protein n=1 Tax=uncultured Parvibaculum sp. TaxID=291828 RepID=UPI0030DD7716